MDEETHIVGGAKSSWSLPRIADALRPALEASKGIAEPARAVARSPILRRVA